MNKGVHWGTLKLLVVTSFMDRLESSGIRLPASAFRQRIMLRDE